MKQSNTQKALRVTDNLPVAGIALAILAVYLDVRVQPEMADVQEAQVVVRVEAAEAVKGMGLVIMVINDFSNYDGFLHPH